jgi:hypothetical protein
MAKTKEPTNKVEVPVGHNSRITKYKNLKHMIGDNGNNKTEL